MKKTVAFAALCALPMVLQAAPYPEANPTGYDPYAADAIERGDYDVAEERLERRLNEDNADASALLNMASVMALTNRGARASSLYERILDNENVLLETADGEPVWSHDAADALLRGRVTIGSR